MSAVTLEEEEKGRETLESTDTGALGRAHVPASDCQNVSCLTGLRAS